MKNINYPVFDISNKLKSDSNKNIGVANDNKNNKNLNWSNKLYKKAENFEFKYKNLNLNSGKGSDEVLINLYKEKEKDINKIINKYSQNINTNEITNKINKVENLFKNSEIKVKQIKKNYEENNVNILRNYSDYICIEDFANLQSELNKNKIINDSLLEKNEIENNENFDINNLNIINHKKTIEEFIKKNRNILLLNFEYKNIPIHQKIILIKYVKKLLEMGVKDKNISSIDFEKLNDQMKKISSPHSMNELNNIKLINELIDKNQINSNSFKNQRENQYSTNTMNPLLFTHDMKGNQSIKNDLFYPQFNQNNHNKSNSHSFDFFKDFGNQHSFPNNSPNQINKTSFRAVSNFKNINEYNGDSDFNLFSNCDQNLPLDFHNSIKNKNKDFEKDKKLARDMIINEFKTEVNRPDLSFYNADNYFAGSNDIKFAVKTYYEEKYKSSNLRAIFQFPSGNEYIIVKNLTDKASDVFDDIMNLIFNNEKKDVFEYKLLQDGRTIEMDRNVKYIGGLNIDPNKKIIVKYVIN